MTKRSSRAPAARANKPAKGRPGAKETLTRDVAWQIKLMVDQFPDAGIDVTWENVVKQTKLRFGKEFRRNVLSQKKWDGVRLISDAYRDAKEVQRRQARDTAPKYANEPRSRLRMIVANLQAEILALRSQLERGRSTQYDEIHALLDTRTPLNRLVAMRDPAINVMDNGNSAGAATPIHGARRSTRKT